MENVSFDSGGGGGDVGIGGGILSSGSTDNSTPQVEVQVNNETTPQGSATQIGDQKLVSDYNRRKLLRLEEEINASSGINTSAVTETAPVSGATSVEEAIVEVEQAATDYQAAKDKRVAVNSQLAVELQELEQISNTNQITAHGSNNGTPFVETYTNQPWFTPALREKYINEFRADNKQVYDDENKAAQNYFLKLQQLEATTGALDLRNPNSRRAAVNLFNGYQALADSPYAEASLLWGLKAVANVNPSLRQILRTTDSTGQSNTKVHPDAGRGAPASYQTPSLLSQVGDKIIFPSVPTFLAIENLKPGGTPAQSVKTLQDYFTILDKGSKVTDAGEKISDGLSKINYFDNLKIIAGGGQNGSKSLKSLLEANVKATHFETTSLKSGAVIVAAFGVSTGAFPERDFNGAVSQWFTVADGTATAATDVLGAMAKASQNVDSRFANFATKIAPKFAPVLGLIGDTFAAAKSGTDFFKSPSTGKGIAFLGDLTVVGGGSLSLAALITGANPLIGGAVALGGLLVNFVGNQIEEADKAAQIDAQKQREVDTHQQSILARIGLKDFDGDGNTTNEARLLAAGISPYRSNVQRISATPPPVTTIPSNAPITPKPQETQNTRGVQPPPVTTPSPR